MNKLRAARLAANLTQQQLADLVCLPRQNIARWESGVYSPKVDNLKLLAAALGCKLEDLI
jgi:transcriptional regulator with XRE-family HTH domain